MENNIIKTGKYVPPVPDVSVGKLLLDAMKRNEKRIGHIEAITGAEETYGSLWLRSVRFAQALIRKGVRLGDIVTLVVRNTADSLVLLTGALAAGAIVNPLDVALGEDDITHIVKNTSPKFIFTENIVLEKVKKALNNSKHDALLVTIDKVGNCPSFQDFQTPTGTEDKFQAVDVGDTFESVAFLLCSSGSTGAPKTVMTTHAYIPRPFMQSTLLDPEDRVFTFSSIYWSSGLYVTVGSCLAGSMRLISTEAFSEEFLFKCIHQHKLTTVALSHIFFGKMARHPHLSTADLSTIRKIWVGGGSVPFQLIKDVNKYLKNGFIRMNYGQTEVGGISMNIDKMLKPNSVGQLHKGYHAKIVSLDDGKILPRLETGEVCINPPFKAKGYWNNPQANEELFDDDGWVKTGDVGYFDEEDHLFLVDRRKNMLRTSRMFSCTPNDLEGELYKHHCVQTAAVVGVVGKDLFDIPVAFVVLKPGCNATEQELQKLVADNLPDYKHLTGGVIFVDQIPMTPSGKYKLGELKREAQAVYNARFI
ncbi:4-coumarate--CoA ligase 1-like [Ctenocephalides felis]|uniref:4-coumarate--CoA ligase 1-like n=1 Tax=Ctenocephalides felis TaxID=7515 RepID=UPI000E6E5844|nr:4-coumarate--CoA ligase 1-like [Ctenocephalides felis]